MTDNDAPRVWPVWILEAKLTGFTKESTIYCYSQNIKALGRVVSEKIFFVCLAIVRLRGTNSPGLGHF